MEQLEELSPKQVLRLGLAVREACRQAELTMPPHGPRRFAHCVRSLTDCLLLYLRAQLASTEGMVPGEMPHDYVPALFAGCFLRIHNEFLGLLRHPETTSFPTELLLPFKDLLCRVGGYDEGALSFAITTQNEYNFGVNRMADLLKTEVKRVEQSLLLGRPAQVAEAIDATPRTIIILSQPAAESRDILSGTMLLHELGHAIDLNREISARLLGEDHIPLPVDVDIVATRVTTRWLMECVADLLALRLFGPCVLLSLRRLSLLGGVMDVDSNDHPSSRVRLALMLEHLRRMKYLDIEPSANCNLTRLSQLLCAWEAEGKPAFGGSTNNSAYARARSALFSEPTRDRIHEAVISEVGASTFDLPQYEETVPKAVAALRSGVPPVVQGDAARMIATAFNAAWDVSLHHGEEPLDFVKAADEESVTQAMEAIHGLALKGIESSFALKYWEPSRAVVAHDGDNELGPCREAVLTEDEIRSRMNDEDGLRIVPLLDPGQISKAAVDLRLGSHFIVTRAGDVTHFSASDIDVKIHSLQEAVTKGLGYTFVLHPGRLVLGATLEYIALPDDLAALVLSRSAYGRLGLLVATAIFVHPRWKGCLTLELANYSEVPIELRCGEAVAQLVLLRAGELRYLLPPSPRAGLCPIRPQFPKLAAAKEFQQLKAFYAKLHQA